MFSPDVEAVAADYVRRLGPQAMIELVERAEIVACLGNQETAAIWREIADAARRLLKEGADEHERLLGSRK